MALSGSQSKITDPEVYQLVEKIEARVDQIIELLGEKRKTSLSSLKVSAYRFLLETF